MKIKINPFLGHALKENLPYFFMLAVLLVGTFLVPPYMISKYSDNKAQIDQIQQKLSQLQAKQQILAVAESGEDIDSDVSVLKSLLPDSENYFSIIYSLEELSRQTNFQINSYQINLAETTPDRVSISVTGVGDQNSFLKFLQDYNFASGRLITAENISFNKDETGGSKLDLNFYNKKVSSTEDSNVNYEEVLQRISEIRDKVSVSLQTGEEETASYPTDPNPF